MWKLFIVSFGVLGWGYYELSGGADWRPISELTAQQREALGLREAPDETVLAAAEEESPQVTRAAESPATVQLATLTAPEAEPLAPEPVSAPIEGFRDAEVEQDVAEVIAAVNAQPGENVSEEISGDALTEESSAATPDPALDLRFVTGSRVNMRSGPGTNHGVLNTLVEGDEVEALEELDNGWVHLRVVETGQEGYMAGRLLSDG